MKITPIILSGGSGTRLWPLSRKLNPKQYLNFFGDNSLFEETALRVNDSNDFHQPIVVCNNEHRFIVAEELKKINLDAGSIILEPEGKNTAPAIAVAALDMIKNRTKDDDIMLVMSSDHRIEEKNKFVEKVKNAIKAVENGSLVTFGTVPDRPETGYGYIKKGSTTSYGEIYKVEKFVEKPQEKIAQQFLEDGSYLWNSGIFMFKASEYLAVLQKLNDQLFIECCNSYNKAVKDLDFVRLDTESFKKCEDISIDYAMMEKAENVAVVPIKVGWSDVGSWQTISDISSKDENDNSLIGDVKALKTKNCYINAKNNLVTTIGVENLIIISLKDTVLIANKNNSQDVKELVNILRQERREECDSHTKVLRPWGSFETIELSDRFKVKLIKVKPQGSLSLQMHNHRAEHWIVVKGTAHVTCGDKEFIMSEDESTYIPLGKKHRLENRGKIDLELVEVQTGNYLGEDDIVRFSDIYGR